MFSQYFGHYLLNRGFITRDQLADALEFQKSVHVKLGVIAVDEGYMTPIQVEEVHEKQKQIDKRFGEIAIELGYVTEEQVDTLISKQKQSHLYLAQALVERGYMAIDQFGAVLDEYKKENSLSDAQFEAIRNGSVDSIIRSMLTEDDFSKYGNYLILFSKNMIRFIDDQTYLEVVESTDDLDANWLVKQDIVGASPLFTALNLNEQALLQLASAYAEETITEVDELAKDAVSEFLNLHNGIYLVNMSNWGTELNMNPQKITKNATLSGEALRVKVNTSNHSFYLMITNQPTNMTVNADKDHIAV